MKNLICLIVAGFSILSLLAQESDSAAYFYEKGLVEKKAGRIREAEKNFARATEIAPANLEYLLELCGSLLAQNRYTEAWDKYKEAERIDSGNHVVIENLAMLSVNLRKWEEGIRYSLRLKSLAPDKSLDFTIARCYYELEHFADAIRYCELAFKSEPTRAEIPYIAARAYLEMHNYKRSALCYEQAIGLDSTRPNWMYEAGLVWYAVPDDKKSLRWILTAGEKGYTKSNDYMENLASAYMNNGKYKEGLAILHEILNRKPEDPEILYSIADAYYRTRKYDQAIGYWDKILSIDKKNAGALYMIGMAYQKKGEKQKGIQLCDKAIEMDPSLRHLKEERKAPQGL